MHEGKLTNEPYILSGDVMEAIEFVKNFASILPAALPAAAISKEEVAVLRQQAQAQMMEQLEKRMQASRREVRRAHHTGRCRE